MSASFVQAGTYWLTRSSGGDELQLFDITEMAVDDADAETADKDTVDKDTADKDTADKDTADKQAADTCLLYTSPSPRDRTRSRMPSSA